MSSLLDKSLDEIVAERKETHRGGRRSAGSGSRQPDIRRYGGGIQKRRNAPSSSSASRGNTDRGNADRAWAHDLYEPNENEPRLSSNPLAVRLGDVKSTPGRLKVENLHYELTETDLTDLFRKIGPVEKLYLQYDKLGRSDGVAHVTFTHIDDAKEAIRKYNGAKAAGQQISVTLIEDEEQRTNAPRAPRQQGGRFARGGGIVMSRRDGPRRSGGGRSAGRRGGGDRRPRRTQEDLDKELDDYLTGGNSATGNGDVEGSGAPATLAGEEMALD